MNISLKSNICNSSTSLLPEPGGVGLDVAAGWQRLVGDIPIAVARPVGEKDAHFDRAFAAGGGNVEHQSLTGVAQHWRSGQSTRRQKGGGYSGYNDRQTVLRYFNVVKPRGYQF